MIQIPIPMFALCQMLHCCPLLTLDDVCILLNGTQIFLFGFVFRLELEDFEMVSCMKQVNLKSEGTLSGYKGFVAAGVNAHLNEDITARGRVGCIFF